MKDRLSLLINACDVLGVVPVLVPRQRIHDVETLIGRERDASMALDTSPSVFDDLYIELCDDEDA